MTQVSTVGFLRMTLQKFKYHCEGSLYSVIVSYSDRKHHVARISVFRYATKQQFIEGISKQLDLQLHHPATTNDRPRGGMGGGIGGMSHSSII